MKVTWSIPVWGENLASTRGDIVRARRLIGALREAGHEVNVVVHEDGAGRSADVMVGGYRQVVRRLLPRFVALPLRDVGRYATSLRFGRRVAEEARRQGADLLIETQTNCAASGAVAAQMTGLPLIVDDCSPVQEETEIGSGLPSLAWRAQNAQGRAASVVVATSLSVRDRLVAEGMPAAKVRLVRNGVDLAAFDRADGAAARERLGLSGRCVFGFVGSFLDWHRVDLLIDALARLPDALGAQALLVGTGPHLGPTLARAEALGIAGRVTSVGALPAEEVPAMMAAFDVGVLPDTLDYGNPMKLTEYAAAAIPAIAPDRPSVREVVRDERTGLLFPPGDADALAGAMQRLASDAELRHDLGARAYRDVASAADWSARARRLLEALEDWQRYHQTPNGPADARGTVDDAVGRSEPRASLLQSMRETQQTAPVHPRQQSGAE